MKQAIIYILSFLGIISQMSCDDQLNALPTQSKVVGNVIVDQKKCGSSVEWRVLLFCTRRG